MTSRFGLEKVLGCLIILTLIAIVGEQKILKTSLVIDSDSGDVAIYDDSQVGGASHSDILDHRNMQWVCNVQPGERWPYCGFELIFNPDRQNGLDLSRFDRIRIWLDYDGPTGSIRIYLRNFDPLYSVPDRNDTTKYNQVSFSSSMLRNNGSVEFDIKDFSVANWWAQNLRLPPSQTHSQFDNIVVLEVQTGTDYVPGEHYFQLHRVELTGQSLNTEQWYQIIIAFWLGTALVLVAVRIVALQKELKLKSERERELTEINALLDSRSQALEEKARIDPLTGAFNRQGLEEAMKLGLSEWRHEGKPFSIVMLDLDHFKHINDTYGHAEGDRVLGSVSTLIKDRIRTTDVFARWGGEEFVLVCRNTGLQEAMRVAEKLRESIQEQKIGPEGGVSASFGVATVRSGETLDQIFNRVDQAMYRAKHSGRNRVEISLTAA